MFKFLRKKETAASLKDLPDIPLRLILGFNKLDYYLQQSVGNFSKLYAIYYTLDELGEFLYHYFPCKKRCSYCCQIPVKIYSVEAEYISKEKKISQSYNKINDKYSTCTFLKRGACSIYKMRPFKCRTHFVLDGPETCKDPFRIGQGYSLSVVDDFGNIINLFQQLEIEIAQMSKWNRDLKEVF